MQAYIISDMDYQTDTYRRLNELITSGLKEKGFQIERKGIGRGELAYCKGCFGCWIREPGECVIKDGMGEINSKSINADVVVFLSPVVFGEFSANIKTVIDRWLPNMLPYFTTRADGSTMHPQRYKTYPQQIMIGYGEDISPEDAQLFADITKKHRNNIEAFVFKSEERVITDALDHNKLQRVGGPL